MLACLVVLQATSAQAAPTITTVSPNTGSVAGGSVVTISGTEFTGATAVSFGGAPAVSFSVVNATTITATTPLRVFAGAVNVSVTTPTGTATGTNAFTYITALPPTVLLVNPLVGSTAGSTSVTITGTNFTNASAVSFGGVPATGVTVVNAATITATTPAHAAGLVGVSVTTPAGTGSGLGLYTYVQPAPTVLLVAPLTGSTAGGTSVTITGLNFTGASAVTFDGTPATSVTVVSDTTITATTPAHAAGLVNVAVTTASGTGSGLGLFTYLQAPPVPLLVTPLTGSTAGGTPVTITGLNFTGSTAVTFGGTAATSVTVVNDTTITAIAPAHAAGLVNVSVTNAGGTGNGIGLYTYLPTLPPSVLLVAPLTGATTGGTPVTITGANFTGATAVRFGGTAATGVTVVNDTTITATAPAHAAGIVDVSVTSSAGTGAGLGLYTYLPTAPPSVLLAAPLLGPTSGGTPVTITGLNFTGATAVHFGGAPATAVTVVSDTTITATAPAHAAGLVEVSVTSGAGTGLGLGLYTYLPTVPPSVVLAAPLAGPAAGGTSVTITGLNFTGATGVTFGNTPATAFTVVNDATITATAPPHAAGIVDVSVTSDAGTGLGLGLFTYLPALPPTGIAVLPLTGPTSGGTPVTISGINFTGVTAVSFGGNAATAVTVVNDTTITAITPAHAAGIVDVALTSPAGTGTGLFTYMPTAEPAVVLVAPLVGSTSGGTSVTITGLNFTGTTAVLFGGLAASNVSIINDTTITATTPPHAAGIVDVSVSSPAGSGVGLGLFTYLPTAVPTSLAVLPLTGSTAGGTPVVITGINLTGTTEVHFGGVPATNVQVVNDLTVTATAPAHPAGLVDVEVTSAAGTGLGLGLFTYLPTLPPSVVLVAPLTGTTAGGDTVTITGLNFTGATGVTFGGIAATDVVVVNDTVITAKTPAHGAGLVNVAVTSPNGTGLGLGLFTYLPTLPPSVLLVAPLVGSTDGGTSVVITGLNLTGATGVSFGGAPATGVTVVNDTTITAITPAHAAGIVDVTVASANGPGIGLGLFTYLPTAQPTVLLVNPLIGSTAGGAPVTITGLNFTGATAVSFGGAPATGVTVINDTTITAIAPAHAVGLVDVSVTSPAGTGIGLGLYTYLPTAQPAVLLAAPLTGPASGGATVTITGFNFTGATGVTFGGTAATGVTVVNDTTITAIAPAHAVGLVDVSVTSPAGTGIGLGLYTYLPTLPPSVVLALPPTGSTAGGTSVTLTGLNLTGATAVSFGGVAATSFVVVNDTTITATAPAHPAGIVNISVTSPTGTGLGLGLFTYLPTLPPSVVLATPPIGAIGGGTPVTLTGLSFTGATAVSFGGTPATGVTVVNDTTITAIAPAHAAGIVDVSVTSPAGTGLGLGLFTYLPVAPPSVLLVAPLTGSTTGGTPVTITGLNFTGATAVSFGGAPATSVSVINDSTITAIAPAHTVGIVDVSVTSPEGTGIGLGLFTYLPTAQPAVLLVAPLVGSSTGGTPVTITGLNFTGATAVSFGGTPATGVTVINDATISAVAPAHAAGIVDVSVTSPAGTGIGIGLFTYLPNLPPTVLLAAPPAGSEDGGTLVTLTGLNFTGATSVSFGSTPATGVTVINNTTITAIAPAHAAGIVDISVTSPAGTGLGLGLFTYLPSLPPSVVLVAPPTGSVVGGTPVTLTGLNFTGATTVSFGGTPATGVTVINDTTITAIAPAHAAGIVDVFVTSPAGTGLGLGLFTYLPTLPPSVLLAAPLVGPVTGGTPVTLTGLNFTDATAVSFGGTPATGFTVINDTTITAIAPAHAAGIVDVSVTSPAGTGLGLGLFTYLPTLPPSVALVTPLVGSTAGGTSVTITGLNFTGATAVSFGGTAATAVNVVNDTTITATTPAHAAGIVNVSVTSPEGTGLGLGLFTYLPTLPPSVVLVTPLTGPVSGGTSVTITGLNFTGATSVSFGGTPATAVTVINDTTITATTPAHAAGIVDVSVTSPAGTGPGLGLFTYLPTAQPVVLLALPPVGSTTGGTSVTLTGVNFTGATAVSFGGTAATSFAVVNDTTITTTAPAHAAGLVNISVTTPAGSGIGLGLFTYLPSLPPTVLAVLPPTGSTTGGTPVTITGLNLTSTTSVSFGGVPATGVTVIDDTTVTAISPAHVAGIVDVSATNVEGTGIGIGLFTYVPALPPTVLLVSPLTGPVTGGTPVTITGLNFSGATAVSFGGTPATGVTVVNDTTITALSPAHALGIVDVNVTSPLGTGIGTGLFTYLPAAQPTVLLVTPPTGPVSGGTSVTITGLNLSGVTGVSFGGTAATSVTVVNDSTITAVAPAHAAGIVDVSVTSPLGTGNGIGLFTYLPALQPTVVLVSPLSGPSTGGTAVSITGLNFTGATGVSFGGTAATGITVVNDNTITAITPAHATGVVNVSVTSPGGTGLGLGLFTYLPPAGPVILSLSPTGGPTTGGTAVTISGTGLTGTTAVTFGGAAAGNIVVVNATTVTVVTPAHAAGVVDVAVTTPAGTAVGNNLFTYTVPILPDPTLDPEVIGLVNAQAASASRLARYQIRNFQNRLERLHNERERRAASMDIRIGTPSERGRDPVERLIERQSDPRGEALARSPQGSSSNAYGYGTGKNAPVSGLAGDSPAATTGNVTSAEQETEFSRLAFWSGGFVNFADRDDEGLDIGHTTIGISGGFDYRFTEKLVAGLGIGYGRDQADIGDNGTENRAHAFSAAIYGSYEPVDNFFLDALFGGGTLNFDSKRYVTATGDFATGERSGKQVFGSVTAAYEIREENWLVSPYGRIEFSRSWLDGYSESGAGLYNLTYGNQTVDTLSGVLGVRANKSFEMDWGTLTPGLRLEYVHDFDGSSRTRLGYTDLGTLPYEIDGRETSQDYVTLGLSLNMQFENDWDLTLDYRAMFGDSGSTDHTVGAQLRVKF